MERTTIALDPADTSVMVGLPTGPNVPWQTASSLAQTAFAAGLRRIPMDLCTVAGSSIVTDARSVVVHHFLASDKKYLFWIDSDVSWHPNDFLKVLALATSYSVVAGTYPLKRDSKEFVIRTDSEPYAVNQHGLVRVEGLGLGFTCVKREVIERLAETKPMVHLEGPNLHVRDVFRLENLGGRRFGEDMAFFSDVRDLGYDVWLDPTLEIGHVGAKEYLADPVAAMGLSEIYSEAPAEVV